MAVAEEYFARRIRAGMDSHPCAAAAWLYRAGLDLSEENVCWFGQHVEMPAFAVNVVAREDEDWFPDLPETLRPLRPYPKQA